MPKFGTSNLDIFPLCLGANVFGWTANEAKSFAVLDAYAAAGGNFIDTADTYSAWVSGNQGGESETILGRWIKARKNRDRVILATKVAMWSRHPGLSRANIRAAAEGSLERLGVDHIDLYYAHQDDPKTPIEETMRAFDDLVKQGKVRYVAASNFTSPRLAEALAVSKREGLTRYVALQPYYNLLHRSEYEGELRDICLREGLSCLPYFSLEKGFLTGKYRPGVKVESARAGAASKWLETPQGPKALAALDAVAAAHHTTVAAVSLAWLLAQPTVAAPIASARTPEQLADLLPAVKLTLTSAEIQSLNDAVR